MLSFSPPPENPAWVERVRQNRNRDITLFARKNGITEEDYERRVAEHLKNLLQAAIVFHRVADADALKGMLTDGRFKSQFETNTSGGFFSHSVRGVTEQSLFGYSETLSPHQRPIYGYLHNEVDGLPVHEDTEDYGNITAKFKFSVIARTSFTSGDSLEMTGGGRVPTIAPKAISAPGWEALNDWTGDALAYHTLKVFIDKATGADGIKYVEAQLHYGVGVQDIGELLFHVEEPDNELKYLMATQSIPWKMVK